MRVYYDRDADVNLIKSKRIAIVGYGSQGHAHANNLKDSGCQDVAVALRPGSSSAAKAEAAGLKVMTVEEAAAWADIVMMLAPDELQQEIWDTQLKANMTDGSAIAFAQRDDDVRHTAVTQVHGVGVALAAIADNGDLLGLDQVNVRVAVVINAHGASSLNSVLDIGIVRIVRLAGWGDRPAGLSSIRR